jgi:hypothetical protein
VNRKPILQTLSGAFLNPREWLRGLIRATIRPRPRVRIWRWADANIRVPEESGGPFPGQLRTSRFPIMRGLFDLAQKRGVHFMTLCASARVGKTLFSVTIALYWIAERIGAVVWLDPSGASAKKFVRNELEHFLKQCPPVWRLAVVTKTTWTALWKTFRGKILRIVASGAEADMHGFNAELAIINERDRCRSQTEADSSSAEKIIARTRLFPYSRLILENSTPGAGGEFSPIWLNFLKGSQHYCYLPCPHCTDAEKKKQESKTPGSTQGWTAPEWEQCEPGRSPSSYAPWLRGWQRLTFSPETKLVPFDKLLRPLKGAAKEKGKGKTNRTLPREKWREETTGQVRFEQFAIWATRKCAHDATKTERYRVGYDLDAVERGATYQCGHCNEDIEFIKLEWMLARFRWVAHNPFAPSDRISAHVWAAYSPFEYWGIIAKEFLESRRDIGALIKFHNFTLGLPFIRNGTAIKEDDLDRVIARTPVRYAKGQLPREAEILTMTVDKQGAQFWYVIRAHGILWDHPEQKTWSALIDWGEAVSWDQILELAGLKPDASGHLRRFVWEDGNSENSRREYHVAAGLVDSGFEAESVYEFCLTQTEIFDPYKGGDLGKTGGSKIRIAKVMDGQLDLWWCWSDFFAANLYYDCIKFGVEFGEPVQWWLPTDLDDDYRKQLTDEYQGEENGKKKWLTRTKTNHLGDCEKMQRAMRDQVEETLDIIRADRAAKEEEAMKKEAA